MGQPFTVRVLVDNLPRPDLQHVGVRLIARINRCSEADTGVFVHASTVVRAGEPGGDHTGKLLILLIYVMEISLVHIGKCGAFELTCVSISLSTGICRSNQMVMIQVLISASSLLGCTPHPIEQ